MRVILLRMVTVTVFSTLLGASALAQTAGQDMKNAGHDTANATKQTAHKAKRGAQKGVNKAAHGTKKGASKVEQKTNPNNPQ